MKQNAAVAKTPNKDARIINFVLLVSLLAVLVLPLYILFILTPAFTDFITVDTEKRLINVAARMADSLLEKENTITANAITPHFINELEEIRRVITLPKVKVFTVDSTIIFSTDPADIGKKSRQSFFADIVATGRAHSYVATKDKPGETGAEGKQKIIETYVPIMRGTKTVGVLEIYYDITATHLALEKLRHRAYFVLLCIVLVLMGAVLLSVSKSRSNLRERYLAELEILRQKELLEQQNAELARLHEQALSLSLKDHLTGLGNRRLLQIHFERELSLVRRHGKELAVVMLDVDHFKEFNDIHGHQTGDEVLRDVARVITKNLRETDFAFRYGGEEFLLLLPETDLAKALKVAEKLRSAVAEETAIKISLGVTAYRSAATTADLIREADAAMYQAKQQGRNQVVGWFAE
ncbi:MAG: response regulator receiver modulated diguanylate cyclase [Deltaproteobacteria bacterium]|nr:response regulator receiver modulated diguanylate cyclase [Deltaproteobacteria bacterium]